MKTEGGTSHSSNSLQEVISGDPRVAGNEEANRELNVIHFLLD